MIVPPYNWKFTIMSHALHTPNMYLYMWTVVWRLTPVLLQLLTICKLSS